MFLMFNLNLSPQSRSVFGHRARFCFDNIPSERYEKLERGGVGCYLFSFRFISFDETRVENIPGESFLFIVDWENFLFCPRRWFNMISWYAYLKNSSMESYKTLILRWFNNHFPKFGKVWCLSKMQIVWQLSQYHHLMGCYLELRWCSNTNNVSIQLNHQCNLFEGIILTCIDEAREVFFFQHILIRSEHFLLLVKLFFIYIQKSNKHESVKTQKITLTQCQCWML